MDDGGLSKILYAVAVGAAASIPLAFLIHFPFGMIELCSGIGIAPSEGGLPISCLASGGIWEALIETAGTTAISVLLGGFFFYLLYGFVVVAVIVAAISLKKVGSRGAAVAITVAAIPYSLGVVSLLSAVSLPLTGNWWFDFLAIARHGIGVFLHTGTAVLMFSVWIAIFVSFFASLSFIFDRNKEMEKLRPE